MNALIAGLLVTTVSLGVGLYFTERKTKRLKQEDFIRHYVFSKTLLDALLNNHPHLEERDTYLVARALRSFFLIHVRTAPATIGMPSRIVDDLWHQFILDTRSYHAFCEQAFGSYFHHIPAARIVAGISSNAALRLTWRHACIEENINPREPIRLPLLFAIDVKLGIANGNAYNLKKPQQEPRCTETGSGCSGCSGFACQGDGLAGGDFGSDSGCGDGGGCGGGCGGD